MQRPRSRPRPDTLTFLGGLSLVWSITSLAGAGLAFLVFAFTMTGTASGISDLVQGLVIGRFVASPFLSLALFGAGWMILNDSPFALRRLRRWAWISLGVDALLLLISGPEMTRTALLMPVGIAFMDLICAVGVLRVTGRPDVRACFSPPGKPELPEGWGNDQD